ncbi:MAG: hypothetical protein V1929_05455 [bacterium]
MIRPERRSSIGFHSACRPAFAVLSAILLTIVFGALDVVATSTDEGAGGDVSLSGIYTSANGARARVYQPTNDAPWMLVLAEPGGHPYAVFLEGEATSLKPSAMVESVPFRGGSMEVSAVGGHIYARAAEQSLEMILSDDGFFKVMVGGKCGAGDTALEMEARMVLANVAEQWNHVRAATVVIDGANMKVEVPGAAIREVPDASGFTRSADLAPADLKDVMVRYEARLSSEQKAVDFQARLK